MRKVIGIGIAILVLAWLIVGTPLHYREVYSGIQEEECYDYYIVSRWDKSGPDGEVSTLDRYVDADKLSFTPDFDHYSYVVCWGFELKMLTAPFYMIDGLMQGNPICNVRAILTRTNKYELHIYAVRNTRIREYVKDVGGVYIIGEEE